MKVTCRLLSILFVCVCDMQLRNIGTQENLERTVVVRARNPSSIKKIGETIFKPFAQTHKIRAVVGREHSSSFAKEFYLLLIQAGQKLVRLRSNYFSHDEQRALRYS